jgi:DNA-binding GntR family transcriptional regulator
MTSDGMTRSGVTSDDTSDEGSFTQDARRDPRRYRQMAQEIRGLITSGELAPGQPAPSIPELTARHGCARQTAAKALRLLEDEGLLIRYPGFGYYVARPRAGTVRGKA